MPRQPPGATDINMFALTNLVREHGGHICFPNRLAAVDRPHIKRCLTYGLVEIVDRDRLCLTPKGVEVVLRRLHKRAVELSDRAYDDARGQHERKRTEHALETMVGEIDAEADRERYARVRELSANSGGPRLR